MKKLIIIALTALGAAQMQASNVRIENNTDHTLQVNVFPPKDVSYTKSRSFVIEPNSTTGDQYVSTKGAGLEKIQIIDLDNPRSTVVTKSVPTNIKHKHLLIKIDMRHTMIKGQEAQKNLNVTITAN